MPHVFKEHTTRYLDGRSANAAVWPGTWSEGAAEMLRLDLVAAKIEYIVEGVNGPEYRDIHSLRHAFVAMLDDAGCTVKESMQLSRHGDPRLPLTRYGHRQLHDLTGKVGRFPDLLNGKTSEPNVQQLRATGMDALDANSRPSVWLLNGCSSRSNRKRFLDDD